MYAIRSYYAVRKEARVDVLIVLVFISLVLVAAGLLFLFRTLKEGDSEHADRLSSYNFV